MGKVAVSFKVMPLDESKDLVAIEKDLKSDLSKNYVLGKSRIEELAFGIKVLKLIVIMSDEGGLVEDVDQKNCSLPLPKGNFEESFSVLRL